jgi:CRP/FNR family transcriptional regulator, cyclic AMP receptor protein
MMADFDFRFSQLAKANVFRLFSRDILSGLAKETVHRSFKRNTTVIYQGDTPDYIYVITNGAVRLSIPLPDGREFIFSDLGRGDVFDLGSVFVGRHCRMNAISISESEVLQIEVSYMVRLFDRYADIALKVIPFFCQAMQDAQERVIDSTATLLPSRLAATLLRILNDPHGIEVSEREPQTIRLSQTDLAAMLPAWREKVNRCLRNWQLQRITLYENGSLKILNREALRSIAAGSRRTERPGWITAAPLQEPMGSRLRTSTQ